MIAFSPQLRQYFEIGESLAGILEKGDMATRFGDVKRTFGR